MNKAQKEAQRLKPFLTSNIPARQSSNSSPQNGSGGGTGVDNTAAINAVAADLSLHKLLDYAEGHGPADIYRSKQHVYHSNKFGIVGGTGVDESNNIQLMLNTVGLGGGGVCVISATNYADPVIQIDKTVSIYYDNLHVVFDPATHVLAGATQCLRIMGSLDEFTRKVDLTAMKLHIDTTVNGSNQTIIELSAADTALMDAEAVPANRIVVVGDKIVVRGQNDVSGKAIEKDTSFVAALAKVGSYWQITCVDELDYTFKETYSGSDWNPGGTGDHTTIYIVRYATLGSDLPAGSVSAVVNTVTGFAVGDVIQVGDARTENAYNASAIKSNGTPYANPAALEMLRIIAINTGTLTISFHRATTRTYKAGTPYYGGVARCAPVRSSGIIGARISYHAAQTSTSYNALQMTYAVECEIHHNLVNGFTYIDGTADYGRAAHALRISYALNCKAYNNVILDCLLSGSGQGYGITDYYATGSEIYSNTISGCRHNILLQLSTNCLIHDNESRNHLISGIDVHGVNSYGFHIYDNTVTQANGSTADSTQGSGVRIGNTSHSVGDHYGVVENNLFIYNSGTSDQAMDVIANSSNITFRNNTIYNANIGFKFTLNSKQITPVQTATNILVEGNRFVACTAGCISVTAAPTYDNVNSNGKLDRFAMIGNISDGNDKHFQMTGVVTTLGLSNVLVMDNIIVNPTNVTTTNYGVSVKYTSGYVHIYNNNVSGAQRGITVLGCGTVYVVGNKTASTIQTDPFTDGGGNSFLSYIDAMSTGGGGGSSAFATNVSVTNAAPEYIWVESGFTANNTTWDIVVDSGLMHFRLVNDAFSSASDWMTVTRSANTATAISIAATALNLSGALNVVGNTTVDGIVYARQPGSTRYYAGMYAASGAGGLSAYDTTGAVNIPLYIDGSIIYLRTGTALTHTHTFDASGNVTLTGALTVTSAAPDLYWVETGYTANNLAWDIVVDSGIMHYRLLNDALSSTSDWMTVTRSANTATVIALAATALNLSGALTVTGNITATSAAPDYLWIETGYTANNTTWDIVVDSGVMHYRLLNDALSSATDWMTITRSANTATAIAIAATALNLSGALALVGNATIDGVVYARQPGSTRYYAGIYALTGAGGLSAYDTTGAVNIPLYIDGSIIYLRTGTALTHTHTFDASGNVTLAGDTNTSGRLTAGSGADTGYFHVESGGKGFTILRATGISTTAVDISQNGLALGATLIDGIAFHSAPAIVQVPTTMITPSTNFDVVSGANTLRISLTAGGKLQAKLQAGSGTFNIILKVLYY